MRSSLQSYRKVSIDSSIAVASPHRIIQMMLSGTLERLAQGRTAIEQKNFAQKGVAIGKAISLIAGLNSSLNMEGEGEVAGNLSSLYDFMLQKLSEANINNDIQALDEVSQLIRVIKEGWDAIPVEMHNVVSEAKTG